MGKTKTEEVDSMLTQKWRLGNRYDYFIRATREEMNSLKELFPSIKITGYGEAPNDRYFFLISKERKCIAGLPFLALAFGGMYNDHPPMEDSQIQLEFDEIKNYQCEQCEVAKLLK